MLQNIKSRLRHKLWPNPVRARHSEYSMLYSADDGVFPNDELIKLALSAVSEASNMDLTEFDSRQNDEPYWHNIWPGEHYKLLAGLVKTINPQLVVEIGTFTGISSLSILKNLNPSAKCVTFDIIPWNEIEDTLLTQQDFEKGNLEQVVDDISNYNTCLQYKHLLQKADLIFVDAAKDGVQEKLFLENFAKIGLHQNPWLVFDDIRLWNMLKIWRDIKMPKLDLTSFGHWSGTGLIKWQS